LNEEEHGDRELKGESFLPILFYVFGFLLLLALLAFGGAWLLHRL
jgi:hypothetical protein